MTRGRAISEPADGPESDRIFFEQNPSREYRARLVTPDELALMEHLNAAPPILANMFWFTVVRQLAPGLRVRAYISVEMPPQLLSEGIPEHIARYLFEKTRIGNQLNGKVDLITKRRP
jgi:hypothetical protein